MNEVQRGEWNLSTLLLCWGRPAFKYFYGRYNHAGYHQSLDVLNSMSRLMPGKK